MLERFHVSDEEAIRINHLKMHSVVMQIFIKMGLSDENSKTSADVLIYADLNGVDTHGVSNMLRSYVSMYQEKKINPRPSIKIIKESNATLALDGDNGLGLHTAPEAMKMAISKAKESGVGIATLNNAGHLGAAGFHAKLAVDEDMIGVCMSGGGGFAMLPTYGSEPRFGTNPIAWAAPANKEAYFMFDAATTQVAGNKIKLLERLKVPFAANWLAKNDGTPIKEEVSLESKDFHEDGRLKELHMLPFGGDRENGSHKGYAFAAIVDIMCSMLGGGQAGFLGGSGHYFAAYDIDSFSDKEKFKNNMDDFLSGLKNTPPAPGYDRVLYPGLPESESRLERGKNGIPYHPEVIEWFESITSELEIKLDW
ncbi:MAG: Ldh family oxidoreductase [Dehalococcoidales bacterium]|jgi:L-2-hydroxycarboxylate dehydrogenase (NAD+)|nr:Ldh family oxidoreductase [Dehalococcoidales bacterium]